MTSAEASNAREAAPQLYVIAGPNGVGKTTFAMTFLPEVVECLDFLNADEIARGLSPLDPERAAARAGRVLISEIRRRIERRESFATETTLSGRGFASLVRDARCAGFSTRMYFLWAQSVDITIGRVRERVAHGGHDIPESISRRRFARCVSNLFSLYWDLFDYILIADNTVDPARAVLEKDGNHERILCPDALDSMRALAKEAEQ